MGHRDTKLGRYKIDTQVTFVTWVTSMILVTMVHGSQGHAGHAVFSLQKYDFLGHKYTPHTSAGSDEYPLPYPTRIFFLLLEPYPEFF